MASLLLPPPAVLRLLFVAAHVVALVGVGVVDASVVALVTALLAVVAAAHLRDVHRARLRVDAAPVVAPAD